MYDGSQRLHHPKWAKFVRIKAEEKARLQGSAKRSDGAKVAGRNDRPPDPVTHPFEESPGTPRREETQPSGKPLPPSKDSLDLRKDTPGVANVRYAVPPACDGPSELQDEPVPDHEVPNRVAHSSSDEQYRTADEQTNEDERSSSTVRSSKPVDRLTAVERSNPLGQPVHTGQSSSAAQSPSAKESGTFQQLTRIKKPIPAQQPSPNDPNPHNGPPSVRSRRRRAEYLTNNLLGKTQAQHILLKQQGATLRSRLDSQRAQERQARVEKQRVQTAPQTVTTPLNPAARSFAGAQLVAAARVVSATQLNPAARSFEAVQPVVGTKSVPAMDWESTIQSIPAANPVLVKNSILPTQSTPYKKSSLVHDLRSLFIPTDSHVSRRKKVGPKTVQEYNQINFRGLGRSMPKGEVFCKSLFRRDPTPLPQALPTLPQPKSSDEMVDFRELTQALIDDILSSPPKQLADMLEPTKTPHAANINRRALHSLTQPPSGGPSPMASA